MADRQPPSTPSTPPSESDAGSLNDAEDTVAFSSDALTASILRSTDWLDDWLNLDDWPTNADCDWTSLPMFDWDLEQPPNNDHVDPLRSPTCSTSASAPQPIPPPIATVEDCGASGDSDTTAKNVFQALSSDALPPRGDEHVAQLEVASDVKIDELEYQLPEPDHGRSPDMDGARGDSDNTLCSTSHLEGGGEDPRSSPPSTPPRITRARLRYARSRWLPPTCEFEVEATRERPALARARRPNSGLDDDDYNPLACSLPRTHKPETKLFRRRSAPEDDSDEEYQPSSSSLSRGTKRAKHDAGTATYACKRGESEDDSDEEYQPSSSSSSTIRGTKKAKHDAGTATYACKQGECARKPKTFTRKYDLERHSKEVHERKGYECLHCNTVLSRKDAARRHSRTVHPRRAFRYRVARTRTTEAEPEYMKMPDAGALDPAAGQEYYPGA
ncbi:hypothetical protein DAEQUDRAFT_768183 [Daedalea quercina L-15889]|uniref:C2H2-type domain-containing protein n=1 Tax=Daedalea quercina L-15889 TaxID=1314783 RepID=A0A165MY13_9APHY|nr:hypothetical protein DAEQUDRAFT_768183 [Daedalea quercina L-15889]